MTWQIDIYDLKFIHPVLREVLRDREMRFGPGIITSLYRMGDPGVHGALPLRGIDERCHDDAFGKQVEDYINSNWIYDPERPEMQACSYHNAGQGWHLHYQVHPRTRRR